MKQSNNRIDSPISTRKGEELNATLLAEYLKQQLPDFKKIENIQQFPGGFSNLTYSLQTNTGDYVLRRPPFGANIKSAHDMSREFKVLSMLEKAGYTKIPSPILYSDDKAVMGSEFYLMERVKGVILRGGNPKKFNLTAPVLRDVSASLIDNLVDLHSIDIQESGLINIGKPEGYVARQVHGWIKRYYKAETDEIKAMNALAEWLPDNMPDEVAPSFIHNDYKYDNTILNPDDLTDILAVLDWEMATVGDPLMDFATTVAYWAEYGENPALAGFSLTSMKGNMTRQEVLEHYAEKSGRDVSNFVFYYAYACFKIGGIVQQIYARYKKGYTKDPRFAGLIHILRACADNGWNAVKYGRISNFR